MSKTISFRILGLPKTWKRPGRNSRSGRYYTLPADQTWRDSVALQASLHAPKTPHEGPVELVLTFLLPIPKSWSKKTREEARGRLVYTKRKNDLSNLIKAIEDALTGIFYEDDGQIAIGRQSKWYPWHDEDVGVVVGAIFHKQGDIRQPPPTASPQKRRKGP